jgi:hypothetical protein
VAVGNHKQGATIIWLVVLALSLFGCASERTAAEVSSHLQSGQARDEVFAVLKQAGHASVDADLRRPPSGDWIGTIPQEQYRKLLHAFEAKKGAPVVEYVRVDRVWGLFGLDVFHLYFDQDDRLLGFVYEHIN